MPNKDQHKVNIKEEIRENALKGLSAEDKKLYNDMKEKYSIRYGADWENQIRKSAAKMRIVTDSAYKKLNDLNNKAKGIKYEKMVKEQNFTGTIEDVTLEEDEALDYLNPVDVINYTDAATTKTDVDKLEKTVGFLDEMKAEEDRKAKREYQKVREKYEQLSGWSKWWARHLPASWSANADLYARKTAFEEVLTEAGIDIKSIEKPKSQDASKDEKTKTVENNPEKVSDVQPVAEEKAEPVFDEKSAEIFNEAPAAGDDKMIDGQNAPVQESVRTNN